jgi:ribosomal protein S18 acetylase RimI-like enzyme
MVVRMGEADDVVVRIARLQDAEAVARIHVAAWRQTYAEAMDPEFLARMDPVRGGDVWRERIIGPSTVAVAERRGRVVGFVNYGASLDDDGSGVTGQVYAIYVDPPVVGTGAGAALMSHAVADLAAGGFAEAVLWVLATNPLARSFYERGGWRPDGGSQAEALGGRTLHEVRYRRRLP